MPDKKKKIPTHKQPHSTSAGQQHLTPSTPLSGAIDLHIPTWLAEITPYDHQENERLKGNWRIQSEPEPQDIIAERKYITDTITITTTTVDEAMPELRKRFLSALTDSVQECQRLRELHEKNTGRKVGNVTLNADSLVNHVELKTIAYEEPDVVVRKIDEALHLAAKDFERMKHLPVANYTNATQPRLTAQPSVAIDRNTQQHINSETAKPIDLTNPENIFPYFKKETSKKVDSDPLAFLNFSDFDKALDLSEQKPVQQKKGGKKKSTVRKYYPTGLGHLSAEHESGGDPGIVSSGEGDSGGASYGLYQFTSKTQNKKTGKDIIGGTVKEFLNDPEGLKWKNNFEGLIPGSKEFSAEWQKIAKENPQELADAEHKFIERTHYNREVDLLKKNLNFDVNSYSPVMKDVIWSTAVQHKDYTTDIVSKAIAGENLKNLPEDKIIINIYNERGRMDSGSGLLVHFKKTKSKKLIKNLRKRFEDEKNEALKELNH